MPLCASACLFGATGVWAAALYSGNNLLYLCGAMLLMLAVAALVVAGLLLARMPSLATAMPAFGEAGAPGVIRHEFPYTFPFAACVEARWKEGVSATVHCLPEGSHMQAHLLPLSRGLYVFGTYWLTTEAPLGLWRLEHMRHDAWEHAVLPAPVAWTGAAMGSSVQPGTVFREGDEWWDLRAYVRGDPLSRVHWRKAAMGEWAVKRFGGGHAVTETALLRVDLQGPAGDAFEHLLGRAYFWMCSRRAGRCVLGSRTFDLAGPDGRQAACRALAAARPETTSPAGHGGLLLALGEHRRAA